MNMRTDDEQLEQIKEWWQKYRNPLIAGVLIGATALFGTRYWFDSQDRLRLSGSAEFEQMQAEMFMGNHDALVRRGQHLIDNYQRTPYAVLAAFMLARSHVEQGDLASAANRLQWAIDNARTPEMQHIARLRLAQVMFADERPEQALSLLESASPGAFAASYEELKGDLYAELGRADQARRAYRNALEALDFGPGSELVQLKLDGLGAEG